MVSCGKLQKVHNRANYTGAQKRKKKQRELMMEVTKDEAATPGSGGAQPPNPISNGNPNPNPNPNPNTPHTPRGSKGKSCKGCTYYTSLHKAKSKNPTCVGFSRALQQGISLFVLLFISLMNLENLYIGKIMKWNFVGECFEPCY